MWQTVELRELRLFLTLAEELHFGRAAEKLQLTPSRVSQSLRALEAKLGAQLVHRTSRRVKLTGFGEQFRRDVAPTVEQLDGVLDRASADTRSVEGTLRLGMFSAPAGGPHLVEIVQAFEALHSTAAVAMIPVSWDDPFERLLEGDVDLMATWLPLAQRELVVGPELTAQPRELAVSQGHPLADRVSVDVEELADYRLPRFDNWPKELNEAVLPSRTPGGRPIEGVRIPVGERMSDIGVRVARGEIVFPTVASATSYMGDLRFIPITGMPKLRSALVWRRPARDPTLRAFIHVTREVLRAGEPRSGRRRRRPSL
jgi:DNA-binding transcriptional LysR family regulator